MSDKSNKQPAKRAKEKPDWLLIKSEYLASDISQRELADKHKVNFNTLMTRANREDWTGGRNKLKAELQKKHAKELVEKRVADLAKFNNDDLNAANALKKKAAMKLTESEIEIRDLLTLANIFSIAQRIGRTALGADNEDLNATETQQATPVQINVNVVDAKRYDRKQGNQEDDD